MRALLALGFVALGLLVGCGKKEPQRGTPGPAAEPMPAPDSPVPSDTGARETAKKNLKLIGAAIHAFADEAGSFPAGTVANAKAGLSWRVQILPHLGHDALHKQFKFNEPWDSDHNKKMIEQMPNVYTSPGKPSEKGHTFLRSFVGPAAVLRDNHRWPTGSRWTDLTDGSENTLLLAEAFEPVAWTKPDELRYEGTGPNPGQVKPLPKLGGAFDCGFHGLMASGAVFWFSNKVPEDTIRAAITVNGAEVFDFTPIKYPDRMPSPTTVPTELQDAAARSLAVERLKSLFEAAWKSRERRDVGVFIPHFPAGIITAQDPITIGLSWRVQLLPHLGHEDLYKQFKLKEPWDSDHNKKLLDKMPDVFASPGKPAEKGHTFLRTTQGDLALAPLPIQEREPNEYVPEPGEPAVGCEIIDGRGGTTILYAESATAVPWTKPDEMELTVRGKSPAQLSVTPPKVGGAFGGGFHALLANGTVVFYKSSLPSQHLGSLFARFGVEAVDPLPAEHVLYSVPFKK